MLCKWKVKGDTERLPTSVECTRKKEGNGEMTERKFKFMFLLYSILNPENTSQGNLQQTF